MKVDVPGRIRNMTVPRKHGFLPLFEAVVNSIHATQEAFGDQVAGLGQVDVIINRVPDRVLPGMSGPVPASKIESIVIRDNGAGFHDGNLNSFLTADSQAKIDKGGKGIGRFTWLAVFSEAKIRSTFADGLGMKTRAFAFRLTKEAVEGFTEERLGAVHPSETVVELLWPFPPFQETMRKHLEVIAERLFEHCFPYLVLGRCPRIRVIEGDTANNPADTEILNDKLDKLLINETESIDVKGHQLELRHIRRSPQGQRHEAYLCGDHRVVMSFSLSDVSDALRSPLVDTHGQFVHQVFVTGASLDRAVDANRTRFDFADDEDLLSDPTDLDLRSLKDAIGASVKIKLADILKAEDERNFEKLRSYIKTVQPEYTPLLERAPHLLRKIRFSDSPQQVDVELYKASQALDLEARGQQAKSLKQLDTGNDIEQATEELYQNLRDNLAVTQTDLIRYVLRRRVVLDCLNHFISSANGRSLEKDVHDLVFPTRTDNEKAGLFEHNLWLVDDNLAFYEFVSSDVSFASNKAAPVTSRRRPDLLAFKTGTPYQHIALVEFKRPDENDNPVDQLKDYAELLRLGGKKDAKGRTMPAVDLSVRIDGYAVCTLNKKLERKIEIGPGEMGKVEGGARWFGFVRALNLTIEVVDYSAFASRAYQRNHPFFSKLGLQPMD